MQVQNLLVLIMTLLAAPLLLWQCADDQEDEEYLENSEDEDDDDDDDDDDAGDEEASEQSSDDESETASAAEESEPASGGGDDFSAMLAQMKAQQEKAGNPVPTQKPKAAKAAAKPAAPAAAAPVADVGGPEAMWVFVETAAVYTSPDANAPVAGHIKYGTKVEAVATDSGWLRIGDDQFMRPQDLTDRKARFGKQTQNVVSGKARKVKSEMLAVRSAPSLTAKVVGHRKQHETVPVVKEANGWTQIGAGQYVRTKYLYSASAAPIGAGDQTFTVKTQGLYIRSAPQLDAAVVGVLVQGEQVRAGKSENGWSQIGPNRYIRTKHLAPLAH